jgi:putative restriction endonuclease
MEGKGSMKVFGEIEGVEVGRVFQTRQELSNAGVHAPPMAGISGNPKEGADSIVVSGGYEDDEDYGDYIIYTGQGGNDTTTKTQIADQKLTRGNMGLVVSYNQGLPVRVIRGLGHHPNRSYRYDGLFRVDRWWAETGRSGFKIYRYALRKLDEQSNTIPQGQHSMPAGTAQPERVTTKSVRVIRDTVVSESVKALHNYTCQVCSTRLERPGGPYAEGAHIRPLGRPHDGPDTPDNILCLCPNCHVLFDGWAFSIADDGSLIGSLKGAIREKETHQLDRSHLAYHRSLYFNAES